MAIGAMQEAALRGLRVPERALRRRLRRDRRGDVDEPAAHDRRAADRRDRADRRRGALGTGRATARAPAELRLPAPASRPGGTTAPPSQRALDVVEVVEAARTPHSLAARYVGEAVAGEDARRGLRDATVREAVADVDEARPSPATSDALARLPADAAGRRCGTKRAFQPSGRGSSRFATTRRSIPSRSSSGVDELVEAPSTRRAGRDCATISRKPGTKRHRLREERDDVLERGA